MQFRFPAPLRRGIQLAQHGTALIEVVRTQLCALASTMVFYHERCDLLRPELQEKTSPILELRCDGIAPGLLIDGVATKVTPRNVPQTSDMVLTIEALLDLDTAIGVRGTPETQRRSIGLYRLPVRD